MSAYTDAKKLQELANKQATKIQTMINTANKQALEYNAKEALKARQFNAEQGAIERAYNSAEAQTAREWQTAMSNTSHQREVNDLISAGLNPVLSANSGAQSYTTSSASAGAVSGPNAIGSVESGAGAYGSLMSGLMSNMTSMDIAQTSANAQIRSAQISADASKYVADMSYKAQMDKPQSSIAGIIDKYFGNYTRGKGQSPESLWSKTKSFIATISKDGYKKLRSGFVNKSDIPKVRKMCQEYGIDYNKCNSRQKQMVHVAFADIYQSKTRSQGIKELGTWVNSGQLPTLRLKTSSGKR